MLINKHKNCNPIFDSSAQGHFLKDQIVCWSSILILASDLCIWVFIASHPYCVLCIELNRPFQIPSRHLLFLVMK
ncbi:hypothetical protein V2J09_008177 [Rumex salicifolius]